VILPDIGSTWSAVLFVVTAVDLNDATIHLHMLDGAAAHTDSIDCLMFSLAPCCRCPLFDVRISPALVNRPRCLRLIAACDYGTVSPTRILGSVRPMH